MDIDLHIGPSHHVIKDHDAENKEELTVRVGMNLDLCIPAKKSGWVKVRLFSSGMTGIVPEDCVAPRT